MFDRYTESARRTLFFSRYEASALSRVSIETEHLLLGLLRDRKGLTNKLLVLAKVSYEPVRAKVHTGPGENVPTSVEIPFSEEMRRVLSHAAEESDRLRHGYIGTEHLLIGLLREEKSVAAAILGSYGMRLEGVREQLLIMLDPSAAPSGLAVGGLNRVDHIERIRHLVDRLEHTAAGSAEARTLIDGIRQTLDTLS